MKNLNIIIISLLCFLSLFVHSQNAPVTTSGVITDASPGDDLVIPVTVSGFNNIGAITLNLDYNPAVMTYMGSSYDPLFIDMVITSATPGRITVGWWGTEGIFVPDGTAIFEVYFDYISGSSNLTWFDNGGSCEYSDGNYIPLNDSPTIQYYINGHVTSQAAPITYAPILTNTSPGSVDVPVTVEDFVSIGTLSLTMEYDPLVLTYVNETHNAAFTSNFSVSSDPSTGGKYKITIGWFGDAVTLNSGGLSTLVTLNFTYTNENGLTASELHWQDDGGSCEYSNASSQPLWDSPTSLYYSDGLVAGQLSPVTHLSEYTDATPGPLLVPVTVDNLTNIAGISLTIEYDPDVMTFVTYSTPVSGLSAASQPLPNGNRKVTIGRFGNPVTLAGPGALLVTLQFTFISGTTLLTFLDDGSSCEYTDAAYNPLYDLPYASFYDNGLVTGQLSPVTYLPLIVGVTAGEVWVPVTVENFTNIGSMSLTFEYDPTVITYSNIFTPNASLAGALSVGDQAIPGGKRKITIGWWSETPVTLTPIPPETSSVIVSLKFTYIAGASPLTWNDNGGSCEYTDANFIPLYDLPFETFYINGLVASQLAPVIKADTVTGLPGSLLTVPCRTWSFTDINSLSLTLDFNPDVLTFDCITPNAAIASDLSASDVNPGRLEIGWFGGDTDLPDGSVLFYLTFTYHGGTSSLTWFDDGATCLFTAGPLFLPLYDIPTENFYKNGRVIPSPAPSVWTGASSSAWNLPANWSSSIVPDSFFDIILEGSPGPPNWPVFPGDFTIGEDCKSLTLNGAAQMQVNGNMVIMPGRALVMNGAGLLKVGGDWKNYGVFTHSTGTIEFTGPTDSDIDEETYPATALSAYAFSTFTGTMTALAGGTAGPTLDDAHSDVPIGFTFNYLGVDYTQLRINTNGWVSMNLTGNDAGSELNNNLFFTDAPGTALAPWWDNLMADDSSAITYQSSGGVFTVEWKNIPAYYFGAGTRLNFQLRLYSGTNVIEFWYGAVSAGTHNALESASIGIKDATGGSGRFIEATTGSSSTVKTCMESASGWPAVNYRFSPPSGLGTENFWKVVVSKTGSAKVNVKRDVNVLGL